MTAFIRKKLLVLLPVLAIFALLFAPVSFTTNVEYGVSISPSEVFAQQSQLLPSYEAGRASEAVGNMASKAFELATGPIVDTIINFISGVILTMFSWILWLAGVTLNWSVYMFVTSMSSTVDSMSMVNEGWSIFRNVVNVLFIFILIYIGFQYIFSATGPQTRTMLRNLIVVALLVNFSLFFTKVIIDVSNILALEINNVIVETEGTEECKTPTNGADGCLSNIFLGKLKMVEIYQPGDETVSEQYMDEVMTPTGKLLVAVFGIFIMLIAAFVVGAAAILLAIRFVMLLFLMILSPLGFAAFILPKTKSQGQKWLGSLLNQAFFAPLFFLFLLIVVKMLEVNPLAAHMDKMDGSIWYGVATGGQGIAVFILNYFTIMIALIASIVLSKQLAGGFGSMATRASGAMVFGSMARLGRGTVGRIAYNRSQNENLRQRAAEGGMFAKAQLKASESLSSNSFDFRGFKGLGGQEFAKKTDAGRPQKGGFKKSFEAKSKAEADRADDLGPTQREKDMAQRKYQQAEAGNADVKTIISALQEHGKLNGLNKQEARRMAELKLQNSYATLGKGDKLDTSSEEYKNTVRKIATHYEEKYKDMSKQLPNERKIAHAERLKNQSRLKNLFANRTSGEQKQIADSIMKKVKQSDLDKITEKIKNEMKEDKPSDDNTKTEE